MSQINLSTLALIFLFPLFVHLSCCDTERGTETPPHGNPILKRDLGRTREILQSCVDIYLGRPNPNTSQNNVKLDYLQCNEAMFLVDWSILLDKQLTLETISKIEDVPNHSFEEIKRCPPGVDGEEIVLSKEDVELFSSTMSNCVDLFLDPPIGFANYTEEQVTRSDVNWCRLLFQSIRFSFDDHGKITSSFLVDVKNSLEMKELMHQNKIKNYDDPRSIRLSNWIQDMKNEAIEMDGILAND